MARFHISVRWLMGLVAVVAVALVLGSGTSKSYLSCHLCHNRKQVHSRTLLGVPLSRYETVDTRFPTAADHRHRWWQYAYASERPGSGSGGGGANRYLDGSTAPDGVR